jgi:hypothetical protein
LGRALLRWLLLRLGNCDFCGAWRSWGVLLFDRRERESIEISDELQSNL